MSEIVTASPTKEPAQWGKQAIYASVGRGTPLEGMIYSAALFIIVFSWTAIGLVFTIVLDFFFALMFLYNFGRYVLAWKRSR